MKCDKSPVRLHTPQPYDRQYDFVLYCLYIDAARTGAVDVRLRCISRHTGFRLLEVEIVTRWCLALARSRCYVHIEWIVVEIKFEWLFARLAHHFAQVTPLSKHACAHTSRPPSGTVEAAWKVLVHGEWKPP